MFSSIVEFCAIVRDEAISKWEPRVKVEKVECKVNPVSGIVFLTITFKNGEVIEVNND